MTTMKFIAFVESIQFSRTKAMHETLNHIIGKQIYNKEEQNAE
jgi:hypothetical protein